MSERLVSERQKKTSNTFPAVQSAYRRYHSTEAVLTKVVSNVTIAANGGDVSVRALLDLSAAFDTVDRSILIQRLHISPPRERNDTMLV